MGGIVGTVGTVARRWEGSVKNSAFLTRFSACSRVNFISAASCDDFRGWIGRLGGGVWTDVYCRTGRKRKALFQRTKGTVSENERHCFRRGQSGSKEERRTSSEDRKAQARYQPRRQWKHKRKGAVAVTKAARGHCAWPDKGGRGGRRPSRRRGTG